MKFIPNGPDIPTELLNAHENGEVVFFCGAGISIPAGLPGFGDLVTQLRERSGAPETSPQTIAWKAKQYDSVLNLMESSLLGGRHELRKHLPDILRPASKLSPTALSEHKSLLQLATQNGQTHLITTNYDDLFVLAAKRLKVNMPQYDAPFLPVPKNNRWNGVVYLHGKLHENPSDEILNRLVLTSGDFGLAYLTERWAARFISELFRNYSICFVGYSITDPILRYIMDALATDKSISGIHYKAYAFGSFKPGAETSTRESWSAKGVIPILYQEEATPDAHRLLRKTLEQWASKHKAGILGKERLVESCARRSPASVKTNDDFTARVLWALQDNSGLPAQHFTEIIPSPSIEWFDFLKDNKLLPPTTPYDPITNSQRAIANWICDHLAHPSIVLWAATANHLHPVLLRLIEDRLNLLEQKANDELAHYKFTDLQTKSPDAIPSPETTKIWRIILTRATFHSRESALWETTTLAQHTALFGFDAAVRQRILQLIAPRVRISKAFHIKLLDKEKEPISPFDYDVEFRSDILDHYHPSSQIYELINPHIGEFTEDLANTLKSFCELLETVKPGSALTDNSIFSIPDLSAPDSEHARHDSSKLMEMIASGWQELNKQNPDKAKRMAREWHHSPYAPFQRLAFFCAARLKKISPDRIVRWLTANNRTWFWSIYTRHEVCQLLRAKARTLDHSSLRALEKQIVKGPSKKNFNPSATDDEIRLASDRAVWLRISCLKESGAKISSATQSALEGIVARNAHLNRPSAFEDEVFFTTSSVKEIDISEKIDKAPNDKESLIVWLQKSEATDTQTRFYRSNWPDLCSNPEHFKSCADALLELSSKHHAHPLNRWREMLSAWGRSKICSETWNLYGDSTLNTLPNNILQHLNNHLADWIKKSAQGQGDIDTIVAACQKLFLLTTINPPPTDNTETPPDADTTLINTIANLTDAMIAAWFRTSPKENSFIEENFRKFLENIVDSNDSFYDAAKIITTLNASGYYAVDKAWTTKYIIPLFDWEKNKRNAILAFRGLIWSSNVDVSLLNAIKPDFLACAKHYTSLGQHKDRYAALLIHCALYEIPGFRPHEFRAALNNLPTEGVADAAQALNEYYHSIKGNKTNEWSEHFLPLLSKVWPANIQTNSAASSNALIKLVISTGSEFPEAVDAIERFIVPSDDQDILQFLLSDSPHCQRHPAAALKLLSHIYKNTKYSSQYLHECHKTIGDADPTLKRTPAFKAIADFLRRFGLNQ